MFRPFLIISLLSGTTSALAAPVKLDNDGLKATLKGALIEMDTPLGTKIPVRFGSDGLVSGEAGELAPLLGSARDRGRWWIDGDRICSKWFRWFDAEPQCLSVQQDGTRLFWREDGGKTGTATLVEKAPAPEPQAPQTQVASAVALEPPLPPVAEAKPLAEAGPVKAEAQRPEPLPLPIRSPARSEQVRVAVVAPAAASENEPAPVETASVIPTSSYREKVSDLPMMKFGGAGLLEASARISGAPSTRAEAADADTAAQVPAAAPPLPTTRSLDKSRTQEGVASTASLPNPKPRPEASAARQPEFRAARSAESVRAASRASGAGQTDAWTSGRPSGPSIRAPGYYRVRGVKRGDVLNVRRGPAETHAAVASIPPNGRRVKITGGCLGEWCPVRYRRATGWVHSFYLKEEEARRGSASQVYLAQP